MIDKYATVHNRIRKLARTIKQGGVLQKLKDVDNKLTPTQRTVNAFEDMVYSPWLTIPTGVLASGYLGGKMTGTNFDPIIATTGGVMGHLISDKHRRYKRLKKYLDEQGIPRK